MSVSAASRARLLRAAGPALVPALVLPILFLHLEYQPKVDVALGSTSVTIAPSDLAVLAIVAAAAIAGVKDGWEPLRAGRRLWTVGALFLALVLAATLHPLLWQEDYRFLTHLVTWAKLCEYALLAPALPLLVRRSADALPLLWSAAVLAVAASAWALLQFAGLVSEYEGRRPLQREPSFSTIPDFAALSAAVFALGLVVLTFAPPERRDQMLGAVAGIAGALGLVLAASLAGFIGTALAAAAILLIAGTRGVLDPRRTLAVLAVLAIVATGIALMRGGEIPELLRYLGVGSKADAQRSTESHEHRALLAYIGIRIFLDHPVVGVGWLGSEEFENYGPYLDDAHRRFTRAAPIAFPSPAHPWGVQNAYVQVLSDLGVVGFAVLLSLGAAGVVLGVRAARAPPDGLVPAFAGLLWLLVAAGAWNAVGLVAGIPLQALTALGFGLTAAAAAWPHVGAR